MFSHPEQQLDQRLESISTAKLTDIARVSLGDSSMQLRSWRREPVHGGVGGAKGGTAIYRFRGFTTFDRSWSLILKILYRRPQENQQSPYYWKREYEVYRSGMLANLPEHCFATPKIVAEEDWEDCCWIWMEDIDDLKVEWSLADYHNIAKRLGRFNGAYLQGRDLPDHKWLTHDWHCAIVPALTESFDNLDSYLQNPLAGKTLPLEAKAKIQTIWSERDAFVNALGTLPKTLCHIDAFRRNILHRRRDVVLIDWAVVGHAVIGEDLVSLVSVSIYHERLSQADAHQLDKVVFAGYVGGLREAGWQGDAKLARLGYTCAMALRGLAGVKQDIDLLIDPSNHQRLLENFQCEHIDAVADFFAEVRRFRLLEMAAEAQELLKM